MACVHKNGLITAAHKNSRGYDRARHAGKNGVARSITSGNKVALIRMYLHTVIIVILPGVVKVGPDYLDTLSEKKPIVCLKKNSSVLTFKLTFLSRKAADIMMIIKTLCL